MHDTHACPLQDSPNVEVLQVAGAERAQEPPGAVSAERVIRCRQVLQTSCLQCLCQLPAGLPACAARSF